MLTRERLKQLLSYDPDTGEFIRLTRPTNSAKIGERFGCVQRSNKFPDYYRGKIESKGYLLHRLAFLYMTGSFPEKIVDHVDGNGLNNAWSNLREVDDTGSARNRKVRNTNKSGCSGVYFNTFKQKWVADICEKSKKVYLGEFVDLDDAIRARKEAETTYGYHENHGRKAA